MSKTWVTIFLSLGLTSLSARAEEDLIIEDFEKKRGDWAFEGSAFTGYGSRDYWQPGRFDRGMLRTRGHRGYAFLKSWGQHGRNVDGETGRALSPAFKVERNFIRFMISGGRGPGRTCVNLLMDGKIVRSATGNNSNLLQPVAFEVTPFRDKEVQIEVVDRETGPWGHVCIDDLIQGNDSAGARITNDKTRARHDVIWSQTGRQEGELNWIEGKLHLSGKPIRATGIKSISRQTQVDQSSASQALRFHNGETWLLEILELNKGKLTVKGEIYGKRTVDLSSVVSLEFSPVADLAAISRPGILYRASGRPLPGKLAWINKDDVAIDCALGIVPLSRQGLVRYLVPGTIGQKNKAPSPMDEIGLRDGSILRGKVRIEDEKVILEHPTLETLSIPWQNLRYLIHADRETQWLTDLDDQEVKSSSPLGPGTGAEYLDFRRTATSSLSVVRVIPKTVLRYKLKPTQSNRDRVLRAKLAMIPGCLGDTILTLSVGGKECFKKALFAQDDFLDLNLKLPAGNDLVVQVDFGERFAYPCGVDLHDAHLVSSDPQQGGSQP